MEKKIFKCFYHIWERQAILFNGAEQMGGWGGGGGGGVWGAKF